MKKPYTVLLWKNQVRDFYKIIAASIIIAWLLIIGFCYLIAPYGFHAKQLPQ